MEQTGISIIQTGAITASTAGKSKSVGIPFNPSSSIQTATKKFKIPCESALFFIINEYSLLIYKETVNFYIFIGNLSLLFFLPLYISSDIFFFRITLSRSSSKSTNTERLVKLHCISKMYKFEQYSACRFHVTMEHAETVLIIK